MGWMLGPLLIMGGLQLGATIVLTEGVRDHPTPRRLGQIVARNGVTVQGIAPTAARALAARGADPFGDLDGVRAFASSIPTPFAGELFPPADEVVSTHPYKTRMMVYRPKKTANFNGTVFVEWTNVSGRSDNPVLWRRTADYLTREGYAYVGINAQHYGVHGDPNGLANLSHGAYVRAFGKAARKNVRDGFLLEEDARDLISTARHSLVGTGLNCGALCVSASKFGVNPSTNNLREHTAIYGFRGGERLLARLDRASRLLAEGYTAAEESDFATQARKFRHAIEAVDRYVDDVERLPRQGRAERVTVQLLVDYANLLTEKIAAEIVDE
jgi:hypothetical protein